MPFLYHIPTTHEVSHEHVPRFQRSWRIAAVLPARLRLVADYVSHEDALEREAAAALLDECAARLEIQRDRLSRCNADVLHALGCGCQLVAMPCQEVPHA